MPELTSDFAVSLSSFQEIGFVFRRPEDHSHSRKDYSFQYQLTTSGVRTEIVVEFGVSGFLEGIEQPVIELTTRSIFAIKKGPAENKNEQKIPANLMFTLIGVAYASTRGMLAEKTSGEAIIPLQNIPELFHEEFPDISLPANVY